MATLQDIARHASVSTATVSRVLNGSAVGHPVSDKVADRVHAAAAALGYTRSAPARALRLRQSKVIGVIVSDILDPYFAELTRGIEREGAAAGFATVLANTNREDRQEVRAFEVLAEQQAAGIVLCGSDVRTATGNSALASAVGVWRAAGRRIISLAPRALTAPQLVFDNHSAARVMTEHLCSLGHRRIVFLGGLRSLRAVELRVEGYRAAMLTAGLTPDVLWQNGTDQEAGNHAARQLLARDRLPDAVLSTNDEIAVGLLAHLWSQGVSVPSDLSLAGIGGTRSGAQFGLTTIVLPLRELGESAARYIASKEKEPSLPAAPPFTLRAGRTAAPNSRSPQD